MPCWRLIDSGAASGAWNMALDQALLESVARGDSLPLLRLYRWQPYTLSLGYGQDLESSVNLAACREAGIEVVRRATGGRAVLHAAEVTYAVIAAEGEAPFGSDILGNYHQIASALQQTMAAFGLAAELQPGRQRGLPAGDDQSVCFAVPAQHELLYAGCKLAGSAQRRFQGAFLQHGSLPVELDLELLHRVLTPGSTGETAVAVARLERRVGWLNRFLSSPVSISAVESALVEAMAKQFELDWQPDQPTEREFERATELLASRYRFSERPEPHVT